MQPKRGKVLKTMRYLGIKSLRQITVKLQTYEKSSRPLAKNIANESLKSPSLLLLTRILQFVKNGMPAGLPRLI